MCAARIRNCPETGIPIYVQPRTRQERRLGLLPPKPGERLHSLVSAAIPDVPSSQWVYVTHEECQARINAFMSWACLNQRSHGSCVGFSAAGALMWDLWSSGYPLPGKLSGAYVYSWINNNRDGGASIIAALNELQQHGTCLESTVGWDTIYRRQISAAADTEAQRFRLESGTELEGFEAIVSAGQCGKAVQFGVQVGGNFERFDDEGCCGYGGAGANHSVFKAPMIVKMRNGQIKTPLLNSWDLDFGPYGNGSCYVTSRHIEGGGGGFIHGIPTYDPLAPLPPAAP